jgi:hypothetical protein
MKIPFTGDVIARAVFASLPSGRIGVAWGGRRDCVSAVRQQA